MSSAPASVRVLHRAPVAVRVVTAASLFDGHDAAINIIRRLLQSLGCEVIHLGHDRSVGEVVEAAVEEDAHAVAVSSYQGGHIEYFSYLVEQLRARGAGNVRVYGGGGGVITPDEIEQLHAAGVAGNEPVATVARCPQERPAQEGRRDIAIRASANASPVNSK